MDISRLFSSSSAAVASAASTAAVLFRDNTMPTDWKVTDRARRSDMNWFKMIHLIFAEREKMKKAKMKRKKIHFLWNIDFYSFDDTDYMLRGLCDLLASIFIFSFADEGKHSSRSIQRQYQFPPHIEHFSSLI